MSRNAHFGIGIGVLFLCVVWFVFGVFLFFAAAAGKDSRGASIYDSSFIVLYVVFGSGLLVGLWAAFRSFRRALQSSERDVPPTAPAFTTPTELATPDERLSDLVKKP